MVKWFLFKQKFHDLCLYFHVVIPKNGIAKFYKFYVLQGKKEILGKLCSRKISINMRQPVIHKGHSIIHLSSLSTLGLGLVKEKQSLKFLKDGKINFIKATAVVQRDYSAN